MNSITQQQEQSTIMPPAPPAAIELEAFTPGEFEYADKWDRPYLKDAYQVISRNEWWGKFKLALTHRGVDPLTGFQFSQDPFYNKIMNAISETRIGGGHSGCSMGCTMRAMETIALQGEATYRRQVLEYQAEKQRNQDALQIRRELEEELRQQMNEEARHATRMEAQEEADPTIPADSIIEITDEPLVYNNLYVCAHVANFEDIPINPKENA
jgi:hypothetical protein